MARPVDWHPLADRDPVPGDPEAVRDEANRLARVGNTIREQVARLRNIGKDVSLKGQSADKLRSAADSLAGRFEKTAGRYEKVSGHLRTWAGELETAQQDSKRALEKAQAAETVRSRNTVVRAEPRPDDKPATPEEEAAERARSSALNGARTDLRSAADDLDRAVDHRDTHARRVAEQIHSAIDDEVADSWWDDVKDFVDRHADLIKVLVDVLSWVATAVAIIAMFIPGLNVAVFLLVAGLLVVGTRTLLAATGNASWMDVLIDSIGLLTMGLGAAGVAALKGANAGVKSAAALARAGQLRAARQATSPLRQQLARTLTSKTASKASKKAARAQIEALKKAARRSVPKVPQGLPKVSYWQQVLHQGDAEALQLVSNIARVNGRFSGAAAGLTPGLSYAASLGSMWGGMAADLTDKALGSSDAFPGKGSSQRYNDWKSGTWKAPVGSTW